jgi:hypothetical protein
VSAQVSQQGFQYFGILNGVTYRIDPASGGLFKPMFGLDSWKMPATPPTPAAAPKSEASPGVTVASAAAREQAEAVATVAAVEESPVEKTARPSNLFPRSGGEPLRAGHPDLWALLVAGTCLEGSEYSAGSTATLR